MTSLELIQEWSQLWLPPQRLPLSQWAERNFKLSSDYSATTSEIQLYGWQREIFDSFTDPRVQKIVLKVGTQLVKTIFIQAALAYIICEMPGPVLLAQPKDSDAETFSKERLSPMLRDNALLREKIEDKKSPVNTITYKQFPGGSLTLVGAMVPGNAARRSIQYLLADEVNKYPPSVGKEGSFLSLAEERVVTFGTRAKIVYACSPTEPSAAISKEYEASDQREPRVKCPACGFQQVMHWKQVKWDHDVPVEERPATARYQCENPRCNALWNDNQRWRAADEAQWFATKPFQGTAGFGRLGHLYSPHKTMAKMVKTWLDIDASKDANKLKVFVNTNLDEDWKEKGSAPAWKRLYDHREDWSYGKVPRGGLLLTAFVDVQENPPRLEVEVKAWCRKGENWSIWYEVIAPERKDAQGNPIRDSQGNIVKATPRDPEPWERLAELLTMDWPHVDGGSLPVWCCGVDSGYMADTVYSFCRQWAQPAYGPAGALVPSFRTVVPTKGGHNAYKVIENISSIDQAKQRGGLRIVTIGTHCVKQAVYDSLGLESPVDGQPFPPGYCHHSTAYNETFFQGLTAEERVVTDAGVIEWRKIRERNEQLDTAVGNRAMYELCGGKRLSDAAWEALEQQRKDSAAPTEVPQAGSAQAAQAAQETPEPNRSRVARPRWMNS